MIHGCMARRGITVQREVVIDGKHFHGVWCLIILKYAFIAKLIRFRGIYTIGMN